jgi:hypothetical protein
MSSLFRLAAACAFLPVLAFPQDSYQQGQQALNRHRWQDALNLLSRPASPSADAEGIAYWKAFSLAHLGRKEEAAAMLRELRSANPSGRWVKDSEALEASIRNGLPPEPETSEIMTPLYSLARRDPDRAVTEFQALLEAPHVPELKSYVVTSMSSTRSPRARTVLEQLARGSMSPDVQRYALSILGRLDPKALMEIYWATGESRSRSYMQVIFNGLRDKQHLADIARKEKAEGLRSNALHLLMEAGGEAEAGELLAAEPPGELKLQAEVWLAGLKRDTEAALGNLKSPDPAARQRAATSLVRGGDAAIDQALAAAYAEEKDPQVKSAITFSLGRRLSFDVLLALAKAEPDVELKRSLARQMLDTDEGLRMLLK